MTNFTSYSKNSDGLTSKFTFIPDINLPIDLPVSTPMNFVFVCSELLMSVDKDSKWNVVCGKIEDRETWQESLIRETQEEVGATVSELSVVGYVICENDEKSIFPAKTYFPVCYSFVSKIIDNWQPKETKKRDWFSDEHSIENLQTRDDNGQLLEIYQYIKTILKQKIVYEFRYLPDKILEGVPATSAGVFCYNDKKEFCIVRDRGEEFFSLPAGGRSIEESIEEGALRELWEEAKIKKEDLKNWRLLGSILVSALQNGETVSQMQQVRFLCEVNEVEDFDFQNNGWETEFRDFVSFAELAEKVKSLKNATGKDILSHLKTKLNV
jgi:8-oxo-dGTP pyrophosphatase MutT (NUDIX family)